MFRLALTAAVGVGLVLAGSGQAGAEPAEPCTATRPCLTPQYCPTTNKFIVGYAPCPELVTGPFAPGGLEP